MRDTDPTGRTAKFFFSNQQSIEGKIIECPSGERAEFIVEDSQDANLEIYIKNYNYMCLFPRVAALEDTNHE